VETAGTWLPVPLLTLVLAVVLVAVVVVTGGAKLAGMPVMRRNAAHLGFTWPAYQRIGALEVAGGLGVLVGLAVPPLGVVAAACLAVLLALAGFLHLRNGDGVARALPAAVLALVAVAVAVLLAAEA
jgi:uncharacterized membrane protein YphA (DoxX/SURF4 family)